MKNNFKLLDELVKENIHSSTNDIIDIVKRNSLNVTAADVLVSIEKNKSKKK